MAKNTTPFLFETWHDENWKNSWTITKPYSVGSKHFLLMLKSEGFTRAGMNAHIYDLAEPCRLGFKLFSHRWTQHWTSAATYQDGGDTFLLLLKKQGVASDGNNVHINKIKDNGDVGEQTYGARWTEGWTIAQFYEAAGKRFLFIYKKNGVAADGNNVHFIEVGNNGTLGARIDGKFWSEGWTSAEFYKIGGQVFLFLLKANGTADDGNNVHIHTISSTTGLLGPVLETQSWNSGWTSARIFQAKGRNYLLLLNAATGRVHVHHMRDDGRVGLMMCAYDRPCDYTTAFGTGSEAPWGPIPWTTGWTNVEVIDQGPKTHLFFSKQHLTPNQERSAKICRVRPMDSVGPMVGFVDREEASIWVGTVGGAPVGTVRFHTENGPIQTAPISFLPLNQFQHEDDYYNAGVAHLQNLQENTRYLYEVRLDQSVFGSGSFRTAPPHDRGKFTMAITACMDLRAPQYRVQKAWPHLLAQQPDLLILGGDNCYANTTMSSMIWAEHLQQRGVDEFADVIRQVPTFATWDDHDFGPNNSSGADKELANRDETKLAFKQLFKGFPFASDNGIHYRFKWRDVEIFMLDVRYFRNHYGNGGAMLGDSQWNWLETRLAASTARFKVLVSGTTLDSGDTETWADDYPEEWTRLQNLVQRYRGVIVVSGDIHNCQIQAHPLSTAASPPVLWEFISSGIAQDIGNECYDIHGFMTLTFDTTTAGNERVIGRIFGKDGTLVKEKTVLLSQTT